jgi:apolipoprotein N-acyltransferase
MVGAFPPFELWALGWLAPALLLLALRGAGPRRGFSIGWVAGFVFQSLLGWWLLPAGVNPAAYLAGAVVCAAYLAAFGAAAAWLPRAAPALAPLAVPSAWVVLEWLRANLGWLAAPWGVLGYSQGGVPAVAGVGAVAGVWGVSFVLVGASVLALELTGPRAAAGARVALALVLAALLGAGALEARAARAPSAAFLRVAVVQAGRHVPGRDDVRHAERVFERYRALTRRAAAERPALVVWPESALPASLPSDRAAREALAALARETGAHLLVASSGRDKTKPGREADRWANSTFLFSPAGEIVARYDKVRLLPFNEYTPLRRVVPWPDWIATATQDAEPGSERTVFRVGDARFGALICWENLFGGEFRRAAAPGVDFVVSLTNEGFTETGPGRHQLLAVNAFRAVENGIAVARAATTGVSGFVAPGGTLEDRVSDAAGRDLDVEGFRVHDVPLARRPTPYRRFGDWIVAAGAAILLATVVRGRAGAPPEARTTST